jgi:ribonuclease HI
MSGSGKRKRGGDVKFYSVRVGKAPGVYHSWDECLEQVKGFKGAICKCIHRRARE